MTVAFSRGIGALLASRAWSAGREAKRTVPRITVRAT